MDETVMGSSQSLTRLSNDVSLSLALYPSDGFFVALVVRAIEHREFQTCEPSTEALGTQ